jgi:hypothetical protein
MAGDFASGGQLSRLSASNASMRLVMRAMYVAWRLECLWGNGLLSRRS